MKNIKIIAIMLFVLLFSGCWDYRELNEMAIITMMGIDYKDGEFFGTMQIVNVTKSLGDGGSSSGTDVIVFTGTGKSMHEAFRNVLLKLPKRGYMGQLDTLVIGEKLAKEKEVTNYMDFFQRFGESRKVYKLIVVQDNTAYEFLKILTPFTNVPGEFIHNLIEENASKQGTAGTENLYAFNVMEYSQGSEPVITALKITGNIDNGSTEDNIKESQPTTSVEVAGLGVFKNEKLIGYLDSDQSIGYNFITNQIKRAVIAFPCDNKGNYGSLSILNTKTSLNVDVKSGNPIANIKIDTRGQLTEINCKLDIINDKDHKLLINQASNAIREKVKEALYIIQQKYKSDVLGFGLNVYQNNYNYWKNNKNNWDSIFTNIETNINVKINIEQEGSIINSYKGEGKNEQYGEQ